MGVFRCCEGSVVHGLAIIVQSTPARRQARQLRSRRNHRQLQGQILGSRLREGCPLLGTPEQQQPCLRLLPRLLALLRQALSIKKATLSRTPQQLLQVHPCMCLRRS